MVSAIIVDLDDCLFDSRHLGKYLPERADDREGWDLFQSKYNECKVNQHIMAMVDSMWTDGVHLLFVTGREGCPRLKELTKEHISKYFSQNYEIFFGIFLTQVFNLPLLHWQADSLPLSHQGSLTRVYQFEKNF